MGGSPESVAPARGPFRPGAALVMLPAIVYLAAVFYLGSVDEDITAVIRFSFKDKLGHALVFGIMQRTHFRAFEHFFPEWSLRRAIVWSVASATLMGILLEFWQAYLPHRTAEVADAIADFVGALIFAFLAYRLRAAQEEDDEAEHPPLD